MHEEENSTTAITVHYGAQQEKIIPAIPGKCLSLTLQNNGIYHPALCGGNETCGKCKIKVQNGFLPPSNADLKHFPNKDIEEGWRLACTAIPHSNLTIFIPDPCENKFSSLTAYRGTPYAIDAISAQTIPLPDNVTSITEKINPGNNLIFSLPMLHAGSSLTDRGCKVAYVARDDERILYIGDSPVPLYALAIDIGTTTIALAVLDVQSGKTVELTSVINRQREYGADVLSRIVKANEGNLQALHRSVKEQLSACIQSFLNKHHIPQESIVKIAIAGNTTMLHLLLGLSCKTLGLYPFTPITLEQLSYDYQEVLEGTLRCPVDILPGISTYVGADIAAGILLSGMHSDRGASMLVDIGTNGEMALCVDGKVFCASTAAGPAFEGGNILWGVGSVPGAISSAQYRNGRFTVSTIDGKIPVGICGSGVIDIVYACLQNKILLPSGRFALPYGKDGIAIAHTGDHQEIRFTQKDVRELQLGKGAIRAGIETLLDKAGLTYADISALLIAGGFGHKININSGIGIGLFPQELETKIIPIGNSSLGGAVKYLLNASGKNDLSDIKAHAIEYSLSASKTFNDLFIRHVNFPEKIL